MEPSAPLPARPPPLSRLRAAFFLSGRRPKKADRIERSGRRFAPLNHRDGFV